MSFRFERGEAMIKYENLVYEIVLFCQKWRLWQDVSIFTNGKKFCDTKCENKKYKDLRFVDVSECENPEQYTKGLLSFYTLNGEKINKWKCFDNPEHLLEMIFEGPLYEVINYDTYTVPADEWPEEIKKIYLPSDFLIENNDEVEIFFNQESNTETRIGYDPAEYDSYEEYQELTEYTGPDYDKYTQKLQKTTDFATREEYEDYIEQMVTAKEYAIDELYGNDDSEYNEDYYITDEIRAEIASMIFNELNDIFDKAGLYFDLCFEYSLTAYKK